MTDYVISTDRVGSGYQFEFPPGGDGDTLTVTAAATLHSTSTATIFGTGNSQSVTVAGAVSSAGFAAIALGYNSIGNGLRFCEVTVAENGLVRGANAGGAAIKFLSSDSTVENAGYVLSRDVGVDFGGMRANSISYLLNTGVIDTVGQAIRHSGVETLSILNRGSITSDSGSAFWSANDGQAVIRNEGEIYGDIFFGSRGDLYIGDEGALFGRVNAGGGDDRVTLGAKADVAYGEAGSDTLAGGGGNDELLGGADADTLGGGDGADTLYGGAGGDYLSGGTGSDVASYLTASAAVVVSLANPTINRGEAAGDAFNSVENLHGSGFNDVLNGSNGANLIMGGERSDSLKGYAGADVLIGDRIAGLPSPGDPPYVEGNDWLEGGTGADTLLGGGGSDTAVYLGATAAVTVSLANASINRGEAAGDVFSSIENIHGSGFDDSLNGNNGANIIWGGGGDDTIKGYGGNDVLYGRPRDGTGDGRDTFVFNTAPDTDTNVDNIRDYDAAMDEIWLDSAVFSAAGPEGVLAASRFHIGPTATTAAHRIIYDPELGRIYYDRDGLGGAAAEVFITMGVEPLTRADFVII